MDSLGSYLTRRIMLGMIPLVLLGSWMSVLSVQKGLRERRQVAENLGEGWASNLDEMLSDQSRAMQILAVSPLVDRPRDWPQLYRQAQGVRETYGSHIIFASLDHQMLFNTRVPFGEPLPRLPTPPGRTSFSTAIRTGRPAVSDLLWGPVAKKSLVTLAVPVLREGKPVYGLLTTFGADRFQERLNRVRLPVGWAISLTDSAGGVIAHQAPSGFNSERDVDAQGRFSIHSEFSGWSVTVEVTRSAWRRPILMAGLALGLELLAAILVGVLVGAVSSRRIARSVQSLGEELSAPRAFSHLREIAAVRSRLDEAARQREVSEIFLRESEARMRLFIEHAPAALAMFDRDMCYLAASRRWLDDYGLERKTILARSHYEVFPEITEDWKAIHRRGLAGEVVRCEEDRFVRKDGLVQWLCWEVHPWQAEGKAVGGIVIFTENITEAVERRGELQRLNASLEQRVEERTSELRAANDELEAFAYAVSHDLRAPLRAMSGFSQALVEDFGKALEPAARGYLDQIQEGSRRMADLIDGLLMLSRCTRGDLRRLPVNLSALAERVKLELERGDPLRRVHWRIAPDLRGVGDPRLLETALRNLLGNAWKYTSRKIEAEISFDSLVEDGQRLFRVSDNGAGFSMSHAAKLFRPFQRLHRQDEFPGLGIGLATVQRIIHRHGGQILAQASPDQGATFLFTLSTTSTVESLA